MGNLESDWGFSTSPLALAATSDHFVLRICAVDLKNEPKTAETLIKTKRRLAAAQVSVEVTDIKAKPLREGAKSTRQGTAPRMHETVVSRSGNCRLLWTGAIPALFLVLFLCYACVSLALFFRYSSVIMALFLLVIPMAQPPSAQEVGRARGQGRRVAPQPCTERESTVASAATF